MLPCLHHNRHIVRMKAVKKMVLCLKPNQEILDKNSLVLLNWPLRVC